MKMLPWLLIGIISCDGPRSSTATSGGREIEAKAGGTTTTPSSLIGQRLQSVERHAGGLGPEGQLLAYQYLMFDEREVSWQTADMTITAPYTYDGVRIVASSTSQEYVGVIDKNNGVLHWGGVDFRLPK
jgi:hypothetical protein